MHKGSYSLDHSVETNAKTYHTKHKGEGKATEVQYILHVTEMACTLLQIVYARYGSDGSG